MQVLFLAQAQIPYITHEMSLGIKIALQSPHLNIQGDLDAVQVLFLSQAQIPYITHEMTLGK